MMKDNIVLIGMPGSGKSTCGVLAAKALCKHFTDTDLVLQHALGSPLQEVINTKGTAFFNRAEGECLAHLQCENTVIATGGSAVYHPHAMAHLQSGGTVIYLKISFRQMTARIQNISTRGIALGEGETLESMYRKRAPLYEKYADIIIDCDGLDIEQTVKRVIEAAKPPF